MRQQLNTRRHALFGGILGEIDGCSPSPLRPIAACLVSIYSQWLPTILIAVLNAGGKLGINRATVSLRAPLRQPLHDWLCLLRVNAMAERFDTFNRSAAPHVNEYRPRRKRVWKCAKPG